MGARADADNLYTGFIVTTLSTNRPKTSPSDRSYGQPSLMGSLGGIPENIRSDNGPEFVAKELRKWLGRVGTGALYIEPGSPCSRVLRRPFRGGPRRIERTYCVLGAGVDIGTVIAYKYGDLPAGQSFKSKENTYGHRNSQNKKIGKEAQKAQSDTERKTFEFTRCTPLPRRSEIRLLGQPQRGSVDARQNHLILDRQVLGNQPHRISGLQSLRRKGFWTGCSMPASLFQHSVQVAQ